MSNTPITIDSILFDFSQDETEWANDYADGRISKEEAYKMLVENRAKALAAIHQLIESEVIGSNDKPSTWVQKLPGAVAPSTKRSTCLSENERSRNALRREQRQRLANLMKRKESEQ